MARGDYAIWRWHSGTLATGFTTTLQLGRDSEPPHLQVQGEVPPASELLTTYQSWLDRYRQLETGVRLSAPSQQTTHVAARESNQNAARADCGQYAATLQTQLQTWLDAPGLRPLKNQLFQQLQPDSCLRLLIQTNDFDLLKLPWHAWDLFTQYPAAEFGLCFPDYARPTPPPFQLKVRRQARILAILGDDTDIDLERDRQLLAELPAAAVTVLVQPDRQAFEQLWTQRWDALFFAGHSRTIAEGQQGILALNSRESLSLAELRSTLQTAIHNGLKLAIFNSCDGLGLARELLALNLPQAIVMREAVPDCVAQEFLKVFLKSFAHGLPLYRAVRTARAQLQELHQLEERIPGATWLPAIFQNPACQPVTWPQLRGRGVPVPPRFENFFPPSLPEVNLSDTIKVPRLPRLNIPLPKLPHLRSHRPPDE